MFLVALPVIAVWAAPAIVALLASHFVGIASPRLGDRIYQWGDRRALDNDDRYGRIIDRVFEVAFFPWSLALGE